jgi:hypothetical protein
MRSTILLLVSALLFCGMLPGGAFAAGSRTCTKACSTARKTCLVQARELRAGARAACVIEEDEKACTDEVRGAFKGSIGECRARLGRCRTCCEGGGTAESCLAPPGCTGGQAFDGTWDAIQGQIFARYGCTQAICHGAAASGGLDLSPAVAYANLLEVPSLGSSFRRLEPGDQRRSYLWLKLAAKTDPTQLPDGVTVGSPMPAVGPGLTLQELEAMRLWIYAGAPETGTVAGTEDLLGACLPDPEPLVIEPLDPPPAGEGVQFVMPAWRLPALSEHEICFATYYDFSDQIPPQFQDPSGTFFRFDAQELRQDAQSHHLILNLAFAPVSDIHDPSFGTWSCRGGRRNGKTCEPTDRDACGSDGICTSTIRQSFACIGFGPSGGGPGGGYVAIGGAQKSQNFQQLYDGVFAQIPKRGILYWNSHAFNTTAKDTLMHARLNYWFSNDQQYPVVPIFNISRIFAANAAPFTEQTVCGTHQLPKGARVYTLSSHTHKRGKRFWITDAAGTLLYENLVYNDPPNKQFDPPLAFDSDDRTQRVLNYCATYNNGVKADGSPDVEFVTRRSRTPGSALGPCQPVACVSGNVGAPCGGAGAQFDRQCDSTPGANDGFCDACRITGGESTENEMFILIGDYYVATGGAQADGARNAAAPPRSTSTALHVPSVLGCASSHKMHAGHGGHEGH